MKISGSWNECEIQEIQILLLEDKYDIKRNTWILDREFSSLRSAIFATKIQRNWKFHDKHEIDDLHTSVCRDYEDPVVLIKLWSAYSTYIECSIKTNAYERVKDDKMNTKILDHFAKFLQQLLKY